MRSHFPDDCQKWGGFSMIDSYIGIINSVLHHHLDSIFKLDHLKSKV